MRTSVTAVQSMYLDLLHKLSKLDQDNRDVPQRTAHRPTRIGYALLIYQITQNLVTPASAQ